MITIRIVVKDFNCSKLMEELATASLPITGVTWAGFIPSGQRNCTPFPEASRQVGSSSLDGPDVALRGELRFSSDIALTALQSTSLDSVLAAHDSTIVTAEQTRGDLDITDLNALLATDRPVFVNHITTWDTKTTAQKLAASKDMFIIIGKVLRVFIRREREGGGAI